MSKPVRFADIKAGDELPELVKPAIDRVQLALFAGASGDHNPIHLDDEQAKAGGLPGIIVHGMLSMAILGQLVSGWAGRAAIRAFSSRFAAMAYPGDVITCRGKVADTRQADGENLADLEIVALNQKGETLLAGTATVALE